MDYRLHEPSAELYRQLCEVLDVDRCYILTEAGPDGVVLYDADRYRGTIDNLRIIIEAKNPDVIGKLGHYDCAGHPVSDEQHDVDIVAAAEKLSKDLFEKSGGVIPLAAHPHNESGPTWRIKELSLETEAGAIAA